MTPQEIQFLENVLRDTLRQISPFAESMAEGYIPEIVPDFLQAVEAQGYTVKLVKKP